MTKIDSVDWTDEMIERLVEEETKPEPKFKVGDIVYSTTWQRDVIIQDILPDGFYKVGDIHNLGWFITDESCLRKEKNTLPIDSQLLKQKISLPEGYQFVDENGNVINTTKIILEKKKKEYPKTYEECCRVLGVSEFEYNHTGTNVWYRHKLMATLDKLMLCRDAYWKLAGEEMGLSKPWEPNFESEASVFIIYTTFGEISKAEYLGHKRYILTFPTEEMRDNFFTNFKKLIESVKELL